jgi:hypothetical protein
MGRTLMGKLKRNGVGLGNFWFVMMLLVLCFNPVQGENAEQGDTGAAPQGTAASELKGMLKGQVVNARGEKGVSAKILVLPDSLETNSDGQGNFSIEVPVGPVELRVEAEGFFIRIVPDIQVRAGLNRDLTIILEAADVQNLGQSEVLEGKIIYRDPLHSTSVKHFTRDQVNNSPGSAQDVNRVLQTLPAVSSGADDNWNTFVVRGGRAHESSFLLDGIEVNNLSHWGSEQSSGGTVNMLHLDFVKDLDFYAGAAPASMPARLSSVTDIRFREGSMEERLWQFDLNMAGAGMFAEGPIVENTASYMVNARVSFLDLMSNMINFPGVPEYENAQTKLVWRAGENNEIALNVLGGTEYISLEQEKGKGELIAEGEQLISGLSWKNQGESHSNRLLFSGVFHGSRAWEDLEGVKAFAFDSERLRGQIKNDFELYTGREDIFFAGASAEVQRYEERYSEDPYFVAVVNDSFVFLPELPDGYSDAQYRDTMEAVSNQKDTVGYQLGAYAGYLWKPGAFSTNIGLRNDYYTLVDKQGVSPRISFNYDMSPVSGLSASFALLHQLPDIILNDNDSGWKAQDFELQRSWQSALSWHGLFGEDILVESELYFKLYDREPLYSLDRDAGERSVELNAVEYSHKRVWGFEMMLQKKRKGLFWYEFSYAWSRAEQEYENDNWYTADDHLEHSSTVILGSRINKEHGVSIRLDVSQGNPYTPVDREASMETHSTRYDLENGWNSERRPFRLLIAPRYSSYSYFSWGNIESYMEISNLLNRRYVVQESFSRGTRPEKSDIEEYLSRSFFFVGGVSVNF